MKIKNISAKLIYFLKRYFPFIKESKKFPGDFELINLLYTSSGTEKY